MKKYIRGFIIGAVFIIMVNNFVFAGGLQQTIDVFINRVSIEIYGEKIDMNNILYNGTTYVPIRDISKIFGKKVEWDNNSNTAKVTKIDPNNKVDVEDIYSEIIVNTKLELDLISKKLANIQNDDEIEDILRQFKDISKADVENIYFGKQDSGIMHLIPKLELPDDYDPRQRPWYIDKENEYYISDIYIDIISEMQILTMSKPVYKNEEFLGVIGVDIKLAKK